jgi:hypothetical protein
LMRGQGCRGFLPRRIPPVPPRTLGWIEGSGPLLHVGQSGVGALFKPLSLGWWLFTKVVVVMGVALLFGWGGERRRAIDGLRDIERGIACRWLSMFCARAVLSGRGGDTGQ